MSTMSLDFPTVSPSRLRWSKVKQSFLELRRRARARYELMNLADRDLQDIGISRCTADFEASKPFWMA